MAGISAQGIYLGDDQNPWSSVLGKITGMIDEKAKERDQLRGLSEGNVGGALGSTMLTPGTAPPPSMLERLFSAAGYGDNAPGQQPGLPSAPQAPRVAGLAPVAPAASARPAADEIRSGIASTAQALGISPIDLATAISFETGGTFDPTKAGPTTQWGQHRGLIQFGQPQAAKYGVDWKNPVASQLGPDGAVAKYLADAGVKPGMGLMDVYSAINAGRVGRYGASDAANGGTPGTVADKVTRQMANHRANALAMFGGQAPDQREAQPMAYASGSPATAAEAIAQAAPMPPRRPADLPLEPAPAAPAAPQQVAQAAPQAASGLGAVNIPALIKNPATRALGLQLWQQSLAPKPGYDLGPGHRRFDANNREVATNPVQKDKETKWQTFTNPDGTTWAYDPTDPAVPPRRLTPSDSPSGYRKTTDFKAGDVVVGPDNRPSLLTGQGTNVTVNNAVNPILKGLGEQFVTNAETARSAAETVRAIHNARSQVEGPGGIIAGQFADQALALQKIGAALGVTDPARIQNTETFVTQIKPIVLETVKGLGAGSGISNADRDFALQAVGGKITLDPGTIKRVLDITERAAREKIDRHNKLAEEMVKTQPDLGAVAPMLRINPPEPYMPPAGSSAPVKVTTPDEANKLPSGTQFVTPDGRVKVRP